jgi:hypothetical protein
MKNKYFMRSILLFFSIFNLFLQVSTRKKSKKQEYKYDLKDKENICMELIFIL